MNQEFADMKEHVQDHEIEREMAEKVIARHRRIIGALDTIGLNIVHFPSKGLVLCELEKMLGEIVTLDYLNDAVAWRKENTDRQRDAAQFPQEQPQ